LGLFGKPFIKGKAPFFLPFHNLHKILYTTRNKDYGLFIDVQDCSTPEEVIVAISMATKAYRNLWQKTIEVFKHFLDRILDRIDTVGNDVLTLKLREGVAGDWQGKGAYVLEQLASADLPVIVFIDELPVMINRLLRPENYEMTNESRRATDVFMSWLRLETGKYQENIRWVICGSIGLEPILSQGNLASTIAHLRPYPVAPWSDSVASGCLEALASNYELILDQDTRHEMLRLLGCNIPHYVQMFFGYVLDYCRSRKIKKPTPDDVRRVYEEFMLSTRGHAELADLEERLRRVLGNELATLALDLLTEAAVVGHLTSETADLLAKSNADYIKHQDIHSALRTVLGVLEHDGYIKSVGSDRYEFISKLVRDWWKRRFQFVYIPVSKRGE